MRRATEDIFFTSCHIQSHYGWMNWYFMGVGSTMVKSFSWKIIVLYFIRKLDVFFQMLKQFLHKNCLNSLSLIICPKIWQKKEQQLWRPQLSNMSLAQDPESISIPILSDNQFFTVFSSCASLNMVPIY